MKNKIIIIVSSCIIVFTVGILLYNTISRKDINNYLETELSESEVTDLIDKVESGEIEESSLSETEYNAIFDYQHENFSSIEYSSIDGYEEVLSKWGYNDYVEFCISSVNVYPDTVEVRKDVNGNFFNIHGVSGNYTFMFYGKDSGSTGQIYENNELKYNWNQY